ncbi:MAG: ABC transporter substrate-binding protein [Pseudomonadota bacterium]
MNRFTRTLVAIAATACVSLIANPALAQEKIRVANSQKGLWDTTYVVYAEEAKGFFKAEGIDMELMWTDGGADTQQAIISGSLDIGLNTGTLGVIGPIAKGAPITIISASMTGSPDLWWYVRQESPIKSMKDTSDKSVSFSRVGASSHLLAMDLASHAGAKPKLVSTGGMPATLTQVMSGQVDVGWAGGLFSYELLQQGKIRRIAIGNDVPGMDKQTVRVHIANSNFLKNKPELVKKFLRAHAKALEWAYSDPMALEMYAKANNVSLDIAKKVRDESYPRSATAMRPVSGFETSMRQAIDNKRLDKPFTPAQVKDILRYANEPG